MQYDLIKKNYERHLWSKEMVHKAVDKGVLTEEQYKEIVGEVLVHDEHEIDPKDII